MRICGPLVLFLTMGFGDPALSADADPIRMLSNELRARIPENGNFGSAGETTSYWSLSLRGRIRTRSSFGMTRRH
jgi:hypothetical protein